jgi:hypothetical protein
MGMARRALFIFGFAAGFSATAMAASGPIVVSTLAKATEWKALEAKAKAMTNLPEHTCATFNYKAAGIPNGSDIRRYGSLDFGYLMQDSTTMLGIVRGLPAASSAAQTCPAKP